MRNQALPILLTAVAMATVTACSSSDTERVVSSNAPETEPTTSTSADTAAAAPGVVEVSGEASCVETEPVGDERNRYECVESLDDERVSGPSLVLVSKVDRSVFPTEIAGSFRLENDGGVWEGDWTGVIEGNGYHIVEGVMSGSGGYEGLDYRATWGYYDWPATVIGTIEPTSSEPQVTSSLPPALDVVALGTSNVMGWGIGADAPFDHDRAYPAIYARALGDELGVGTRLHPHYQDPDSSDLRHFDVWLELLDTDDQLRSDLEGAEVVVIEVGHHTILAECGWVWVDECLIDAMADMPERYDALLSRVRALVPEQAVVLVIKQGIPGVAGGHLWVKPSWPELRAESFDVWWDGIDAAAARHDALVVDGVTPMNGPFVDRDLFAAAGYWQADGTHFSQEGHLFVAHDLLSVAGPSMVVSLVGAEAP